MKWLPRHWSLALAVTLALIAVVIVAKNPSRVYWAKTEVVFIYPGLTSISPTFEPGTDALVNFAELVRLKVNDQDEEGDTIAGLSGGTLFGAGFRQGVSVVLPNMGGQWTKAYSQPRLSVEVVDTDPARVHSLMLTVLDAISLATKDLQTEVPTPAHAQVTVTTIPQPVEVIPEGPTSSMTIRGYAAGLAALLLLVPLVSVRSWRRRETKSSGASPG